jgi:hypothetical protein
MGSNLLSDADLDGRCGSTCGADEPSDGPADGRLDVPGDGEGCEDDAPVSVDRLSFVAVDRSGSQIALGRRNDFSRSDLRGTRVGESRAGNALVVEVYGLLALVAAASVHEAWPSEPAPENGIDIALAVHLVRLACKGAYNVGILFSRDTDLVPR